MVTSNATGICESMDKGLNTCGALHLEHSMTVMLGVFVLDTLIVTL